MARRTADSVGLAGREDRGSSIAYIDPPTQLRGSRYVAVKPETLSQVLRQASTGDMEGWTDFCDAMLEKDAHLASLVETRTRLLLGSRWEMEPARVRPEERQLAEEAAAFCQEQMEDVPDVERLWSDLYFGTFNGLGALEHNPVREGRRWNSYPHWVHASVFRYRGTDSSAWTLQVKTHDRQWIDLPERKFVVHVPRNRSTYPTQTALLRQCAWEWLFKFWAVYFWTSGAERLGNPPIIGKTPDASNAATVKSLRNAAEQLSSGQVAILQENTSLEFPNTPMATSASVWEQLVKHLDFAEAKAVLGSTLNVEIGDTGGAYAAAQSQAAATIRPRIMSDAMVLGGTVSRDWCEPLLFWNQHLFGNRMPPVPKPKWDVEFGKENTTASVGLMTLAVQSNAVRKDELRSKVGLAPLGEEGGGDDWATMPDAGGEAGFADDRPAEAADEPGRPHIEHATGGEWVVVGADGETLDVHVRKQDAVEHLREILKPPSEEGAAPRPFRRQLTLPWTSVTSSTSRARTSPLQAALYSTSDDPPKPRSGRR